MWTLLALHIDHWLAPIITAVITGGGALLTAWVKWGKMQKEYKIISDEKEFNRVLQLLDRLEQQNRERLLERSKLQEQNIELKDEVCRLRAICEKHDQKISDLTEEIERINITRIKIESELLHEWFENDQIPTCKLNVGGRFQYINEAFERWSGYPEATIVEMCLSDIIHPNDYRGCEQMLRDLKNRNRESCSMQMRLISSDKLTWLSFKVTLIACTHNDNIAFIFARMFPNQDKNHPAVPGMID